MRTFVVLLCLLSFGPIHAQNSRLKKVVIDFEAEGEGLAQGKKDPRQIPSWQDDPQSLQAQMRHMSRILDVYNVEIPE